MRKEFDLPIAELRYFTIECPYCHTAATHDLAESDPIVTDRCLFCHASWEDNHFPNMFKKTYQEHMRLQDDEDMQFPGNPKLSFRVRYGISHANVEALGKEGFHERENIGD